MNPLNELDYSPFKAPVKPQPLSQKQASLWGLRNCLPLDSIYIINCLLSQM